MLVLLETMLNIQIACHDQVVLASSGQGMSELDMQRLRRTLRPSICRLERHERRYKSYCASWGRKYVLPEHFDFVPSQDTQLQFDIEL